MAKKEEIIRVIYAVIDRVNEGFPKEGRLSKGPMSVLLGPDSPLDSLAFINFIIEVEQELSLQMGISVTLANEQAMTAKESPFRNVENLTDYILSLTDNSG